LWDVLHKAKLDDADLSGLRNIASGGQALPVNLLEEIRAHCPQAAMGTGYGMTECSGAIAQAVGDDFTRQPASAGRILPLVDVRIEAPDAVALTMDWYRRQANGEDALALCLEQIEGYEARA